MKILVSNSILFLSVSLMLPAHVALAQAQVVSHQSENQQGLATVDQNTTRNGLSFRSLQNGVNPKQAQDGQSANLATLAGEGFFKKGDTANAISAFQAALTYDANDIIAFRGLSKCYTKLGDTSKALDSERRAVYFNDPAQRVIRESSTSNLMFFASLLDKAGQTAEAITIYNYGATLLKSMDGKPYYGYMMPLFGTEAGQISYASNRLQALTQVGRGIFSLDTQELKPAERLEFFKEAVRLYPDSPVVHAYLGDQLADMGDTAAAKVANTRADGLGLVRVLSLLEAQFAEMRIQKAQAAGK